MNQELHPSQHSLEQQAFEAVTAKDFSPLGTVGRYNAAKEYINLDTLDTLLNKHGFSLDQINTDTFETFDNEACRALSEKFSSILSEAKFIQDKNALPGAVESYTHEIADLLIINLRKTS